MSCRTTSGGSVSLRLAKAFSGLSDSTLQTLFHALKREGTGCPPPSDELKTEWRNRQRVLLQYAKLTDAQKEHSERDLLLAMNEDIDGDLFHAWHRLEVRARQEIVLDSIQANVVDLSPPLSQFDEYEFGPDGRPLRVWYCSYGSNLSKDRFLTYIKGGTPDGSASSHPGCRNKELPLEDIPIRFDGRMHFSGSSSRWGQGGVAFMDNEDNLGRALGRAYNVTMEQFDDIAAQENGRSVGSITTKIEEVLEKGSTILLATGLYGNLVHIGDYKGAPAFTFTGDFSAEQALLGSFEKKTGYIKINQPSPNYIRVIGSGLKETFDLTIDQQVDYIRGSLGSEDMTRSKIKEILESPPEVIEKPIKYSSTYPSSYGGYGEYYGEYYGGVSNPSLWDDLSYSSTTKFRNSTRQRWTGTGNEEEQLSDEEYSEEMARFLTEDRDTPWFNEPRFNGSTSVEEEDEFFYGDEEEVSMNITCRVCGSVNHMTRECTSNPDQGPSLRKTNVFPSPKPSCLVCLSNDHGPGECPKAKNQPSSRVVESFKPIATPIAPSDEPLFPPSIASKHPDWRRPSIGQQSRLDDVLVRMGVAPKSNDALLAVKKAIGYYMPGLADTNDLEDFLEYASATKTEELKRKLLPAKDNAIVTSKVSKPGKGARKAIKR